MKTDPEIKALFAQYTDANVTKRDGVWVVNSSINLSERELTELPFKGITYEVIGYFDCSNNQLTSLVGAPQEVSGGVICNNNQLTSLEGAPQKVGYLFCQDNQLTSLEGAPLQVGYFDCSNNQLTSLEGSPQYVSDSFACENNQLVTLYGAPKFVKGNFHASYSGGSVLGGSNPLISLIGCPEEISGYLEIHNCNLVNFTGISSKIGGKILCDGNPLTSLDGLPEGWEEKLCDHKGEKLTTTLTRTTLNQIQGMQF